MKIKIINWKDFSNKNAIYFTNDVNLVDEFEVYASYKNKRKRYFLIFINFGRYETLIWIEEGKYYKIIDEQFDDEYVKVNHFYSKYENQEEFISLVMRKIIAKKWMYNLNSFFAMVIGNRSLAQKIFIENEINS